MKHILITLLSLCILSCSRENTVEIAITLQNGYGPFNSKSRNGHSSYDENDTTDPWNITRLNITGIPEHWTDVRKGDIHINLRQVVCQHYFQGNVSKESYDIWISDTTNLSKQPLKCQIAYATGRDSTGVVKMIVDANNNLDLSDDEIFTPIDHNLLYNDSVALSNAVTVTYERLYKDRIISEKVPLSIGLEQIDYCWYNFQQYATAKFKNKEFAVKSGGFADLAYDELELVMMDDEKRTEYSKNEYLSIDDKFYRFNGINMNKGVMILEKTNLPKNQLYSTQIGFRAFPIESSDFKTGEKISLNDYRGKYLLLDFWAVWCGPCIAEFPELKVIHDSLYQSKIEILGVAVRSSPEAVEEIMNLFDVSWKQITNKQDVASIEKKYGINSYPTSFLIDPDGVIIAKNIRSRELKDKLKELFPEN